GVQPRSGRGEIQVQADVQRFAVDELADAHVQVGDFVAAVGELVVVYETQILDVDAADDDPVEYGGGIPAGILDCVIRFVGQRRPVAASVAQYLEPHAGAMQTHGVDFIGALEQREQS